MNISHAHQTIRCLSKLLTITLSALQAFVGIQSLGETLLPPAV